MEQVQNSRASTPMTNIPEHVAIIMDGNRRWAKKRGVPIFLGHKAGAETLVNTVRSTLNLGIKILTVFVFSTENWSRSPSEVKKLMTLLHIYLRRQKKMMIQEGVKLSTIGDLSKLSPRIQKTIEETKKATQDGNTLKLVLALNYGGRNELVRSCKKIVEAVTDKNIEKEKISEETITDYLDTSFLPDPDLIIRTSGEMRLSNFLLWQSCYSEFYVTETLWPDFTEKDLKSAIGEFQKRERRLGGK